MCMQRQTNLTKTDLLHTQQFDLELKVCIRRNTPCREAARAVAHVCRDGNASSLADGHAKDTLVPAGNDLANTSLPRERLLASVFGRPEFLCRAIRLEYAACRVYSGRLTPLKSRTGTRFKNLVLESRERRHFL